MTEGSGEATGALAPERPPTITAEVRSDGTGQIVVDGVLSRIARADLAEAGAEVTSRVAALAARFGGPLQMEVRDPEGIWELLVHPDGRVDQAPPDGELPEAPATTGSHAAVPDEPGPAPRAVPAGQVLPTLEDLVATRRSERREPAHRGFRRGVAVTTFGLIKPGPGRAERRVRAAMRAVRRPLDGPRTVVVVNPKGGAHKTTASMLLAATFGLQRGGYTLAWDNNETHGTLGWRAAVPEHDRTAVDLLHTLPELAAHGLVRIGDLDGFVRSQPAEQFDVLASDENAASIASIDGEAYGRLHRLLSQFYRVLVIDTGNNMRASNWRAAVESADQLVIVSTVREDTAQSAAWALDALRAAGHEEQVRRAVTILSAPGPKVDKDLEKRLRAHFGALTRTVVSVPYEPGLVGGGRIEYRKLKPATREAWLHATAAVAEGL